jgi:hypothetical protein
LIADDCRHYGAILHAFCVMQHYVRRVLRTPLDHNSSWLLQRMNSNAAKTLHPLLLPEERAQLDRRSP